MTEATDAAPTWRRILVVEDDSDTAVSMAKLLEIYGNEVRIERGGPEAIAAAVAWRPDVILLDLGLPRMDGYEVAARIRCEDPCRHAVIIAVTGYGLPDARERSRAAGIDLHLLKPVDLDELLSLMAGAGVPRPTLVGPGPGDGRGSDRPGNPPITAGFVQDRRPALKFGTRAPGPAETPSPCISTALGPF